MLQAEKPSSAFHQVQHPDGGLRCKSGKIIFVGNFWEYFGLSIALLILSIVTIGIAFAVLGLLVVQVFL